MKTKTPKVKINRITIARLYNLGDYEHARYELSADVPDGVSSLAVMHGLVTVIRACNPKVPVSEFHLQQLQKRINLTEKEAEVYYGPDFRLRQEEEKVEYHKLKRKLDEWKESRNLALKAIDDLTSLGDGQDDIPF